MTRCPLCGTLYPMGERDCDWCEEVETVPEEQQEKSNAQLSQ